MPQELTDTQIAEIVSSAKAGAAFFAPDGGLKSIQTAIANCVTKDDVSFKTLKEQVEQQTASIDALAKRIRNNKDGVYVPGMEDVKANIPGLLLALSEPDAGSRRAFERHGCKAEYELALQWTDRWMAANAEIVRNQHQRLENARKAAAPAAVINDLIFGNFIPEQLMAEIIAPLYAASSFINFEGTNGGQTCVTVLGDLTSPSAKWKGFNTGATASWAGEGQKYTVGGIGNATQPLSLDAKKLYSWIQIDEEWEKFGSPQANAFVNRDIVEVMAMAIDDVIPFGKGGAQPLGIVNTKGVQIYRAENDTAYEVGDASLGSNWLGKALDFDILTKMQRKVAKNNFRANPWTWVMDIDARIYLAQRKTDNYANQTTNQPYLIAPMATAARIAELIGKYIETTRFTAKKAGANILAGLSSGAGDNLVHMPIFGGAMYEDIFGRWQGIEVKDDKGVGKDMEAGKRNIRMTMWCDNTVRYRKGIIVCDDAKVA